MSRLSKIRNGNQPIEVKLSDDGKSLVRYTVQNFYDEVMSDVQNIAVNKFWHINDDWQDDIRADADEERRGRRYSISRDSINGPVKLASNLGQYGSAHLCGLLGFQANAVDPSRFRDEADKLIARGYLKKHLKKELDWNNDESITEFFLAVQASLRGATSAQARDIVNAGPSIFIFTELLKRTERVVREDLTEMWARKILPVHMLNTWLPMWSYIREAEQTGHLPQYLNVEETPSNIGRHRERRVPETKRLVFFDDGASWTWLELERMAEAVANGAANYQFDMRRTDEARRNLLYKENLLAFFGDPEVQINGLLSPSGSTGIQHIPAVAQFGDDTPELDRQLLINTAMQIANETDTVLQPDMIGLSNRAFFHCISRRYGSVDNPSDQTVAQAALVTLQDAGISTLTRIPELGPRASEVAKLVSRGVNATEAERLSGGIAGQDVMVVMKRDPEVIELIVAKDITNYPAAETMRGKTEIRMVMGSGGVEVYKPAGIKIITNTVGENTLPVPSITP